MSDSSKRRRIGLITAPSLAALGVIAIGAVVGTYWQYVLAVALSAAFVGAALTMLVGFARCITLASGAMMALGAYSSTVAATDLGLSFPAAALIGMLTGGLGGLLLAIPGVRFRSHNLAMVTLVFQEVLLILIRESKGLTGGAEGITVPPPAFAGTVVSSDFSFLVILSIGTGLGLLPLSALLYGSFGKNLRALSASEVAARAFGINVERSLIAAFALSSAAIAFAAALIAPRFRIIDPESYGILSSIFALAYPIIGGSGSIWGGLLGGALLRVLPELLRPVADYIEFATAGLVIAIILFLPGGLIDAVGYLFRAKAAGRDLSTARPAQPVVRPIHPAHAKEGTTTGELVAEVRNLSMTYGALKAVNDVSLQIQRGTIHGLMGPNGAGKTTLFNTISGFIRPDSGEVFALGASLARLPVHARIGLGITRTFQHVAVFPALSCLDNVRVGLGRNRIGEAIWRSVTEAMITRSSREEDAAALAALDAVGLAGFASYSAGMLSLGNQRRLELARAIVSHPRLLLLDEPVSGVSVEEAERIAALLRHINRDLGITMLIVEHNIGFLVSLCDALSVMNAGSIVAEGLPESIVDLPIVRQIYFGDAAVA